jgi:hypothetical protein
MEHLKHYLQLFRAQTAPATLMLILLPFLHGGLSWWAIPLGLYAIYLHWISFGHNSLMDSTCISEVGKPPPDFLDPNKRHHPLISGKISLSSARKLILWNLVIIAGLGGFLTLKLSSTPEIALLFFSLFLTNGLVYNEGLSKVSLFGFVPISFCFTFLGLWAWFLSHPTLGRTGIILSLYLFTVILFQIGWSGHLKDFERKEPSNFLLRLGADIKKGEFHPGKSALFGFSVKLSGVVLASLLLTSPLLLIWFLPVCSGIIYLLCRLVLPRPYQRNRELLNMSLMEILSIYLPIPLLLPCLVSALLMIIGVLYFFMMNLWLWGFIAPKV